MNRPDPLTQEERELARLLGRPGDAIAPSAQADEAIAAQARIPLADASSSRRNVARLPAPARARHGYRRGLVSSLAVAASLVLVVGLAWQLRPTPPPAAPPQVLATTATIPAQARKSAAPAAGTTSPAPQSAASAMPTPPAAPARAATAKAVAAPYMPAETAKPAPIIAAPAPSVPAPAAPPPPMPSMAPTPVPASAAMDEAAPAQQALRLRSAAADAPPASQTAPIQQEPSAIEATPRPSLDDDARLSRQQWLERIRARWNEGDTEGARASLRRLVQVYPEAHIPRDLRPLLRD